MPSGLRWIHLRTMIGGGPTDHSRVAQASVPGPYRGRLRRAMMRAISNMFIRLSDGALVKRNGASILTPNSTFGGVGRIRKLLNYMRPDQNTLGHALIVQSNQGRIGFIHSGGTSVGIIRDLSTVNPGGNSGAPNELLRDVDIVVFNGQMLACGHQADPWIWNGIGPAGNPALSPTPYPSSQVHDASFPVAAMITNRPDQSVAPSATIKGPFVNGDRAWYLFAFEIGVGYGVVPHLAQPAEGQFGPSPTDIPHIALMLRYVLPAAKGALRVPTLRWPANRGISACRIYRSRINREPQSLADFFYIGKTVVSGEVLGDAPAGGNFLDTIADADLGAQQPFGPPLSLYRAKEVVEHNQRLVFANLKSPRAGFALVGANALGAAVINVTFNAASPEIVITVTGEVAGAFSTPFNFTLATQERLGEMVARFNREIRSASRVATGIEGGQTLAGDLMVLAQMVLLGDPEQKIVSTDLTSDLSIYPDTDMTNPQTVEITERAVQFNFVAGNPEAIVYPSDIAVTDIRNPFVHNSFLRFGVGEHPNDPIIGLAKYRAPSGRQEVLIGHQAKLDSLVGSGVEINGIPDYALREISRLVGFWGDARQDFQQSRSVTEAPDGVYFVSHRGLEFFDGARVTRIALSDDMKDDFLEGVLFVDSLERTLGWHDGRVYYSGRNKRGDYRIYVYDERAAALLGDPRSSWIRLYGKHKLTGLEQAFVQATAFAVWQSGDSPFRSPIFVAGTADGYLVELFDPAQFRDFRNGVPAVDEIPFNVIFPTIELQDGHRVRVRAIRPRFSKTAGELFADIKLDDRPAVTMDLTNHALLVTGDDTVDKSYEMLPYVPVGLSFSPRARRIQVELRGHDTSPFELYGLDIGFVPSEGSVTGATR